MYPTSYSERAYAGQSPFGEDHCVICGALGECPDTASVPMPYPPVDLDDAEYIEAGGPLRSYTVTERGYATTMQLNDSDAVRYGAAAVLIP